LNLENIVDGITSYKLIVVIVCFLIIFGGLIKVNIVNKVVCFDGNDVTMFQGLKRGVITLIGKIESLFAFMYTYYSQSPKRHLECVKLVKVIKLKGLKFSKNIKTRWISRLATFK
jgi:hypothetical protein